MFNNFEQGHVQFLEPTEPKVVATDWCGEEIHEGDGEFLVSPDGEIVAYEDLQEWIGCYFTATDF